MSLDDLKGNVLVGVGWQDICTRFHRVHPEACKHCVESDIELSAGISPGEFKLYKCKNNMMDLTEGLISELVFKLTGSYEVKMGENTLNLRTPWKRISM